MTTLLAAAGRSFLRAFAAAIIVLAPGILSAPNLNQARALGVAALFASLAMGFKAIQMFVPQLSFGGFVSQPIAAWLDSFVRAALGAFIVSIIGILNAPDLSTWRSLVTGALTGAFAAGFRALEGLLTPGERPQPGSGLHLAA